MLDIVIYSSPQSTKVGQK